MEIIGIIVLCVIIFVICALLGWIVKGLGVVVDFLFKGWGSCISVIFWIFAICIILMALAM